MKPSVFFKIYYDPAAVFSDNEFFRSRNVIVALALQILAPTLTIVYYYYTVNFAWLVNYLGEQQGSGSDSASLKFLTPALLSGVSVVSLLVMVPLFTVLLAVYFYIVSKAQGGIGTFWRWFAATVWASMPSLLVLPLGILALAVTTDGRLPPSGLNPTSLNQLVLQLDDRSVWMSFGESITVPMLWTVALYAVAYRAIAESTVNKSVVIAAAPFGIFYGIWALIIAATAAI